jgi:vacuolar-type H+-ATPase subunit H
VIGTSQIIENSSDIFHFHGRGELVSNELNRVHEESSRILAIADSESRDIQKFELFLKNRNRKMLKSAREGHEKFLRNSKIICKTQRLAL